MNVITAATHSGERGVLAGPGEVVLLDAPALGLTLLIRRAFAQARRIQGGCHRIGILRGAVQPGSPTLPAFPHHFSAPAGSRVIAAPSAHDR